MSNYSPLWRFMPFAVVSAVAVGLSVHLEFGKGGIVSGMIVWLAWWMAANVAHETWAARKDGVGR